MSQIVSEVDSRPQLFFLWNAVAEEKRDLNGRKVLVFELSTVLNGEKLVAELGIFTAQNDSDDIAVERFNHFMREKYPSSLYTFGYGGFGQGGYPPMGIKFLRPEELLFEKEVVALESFQRELHGEPYRFKEPERFMQLPCYWYFLHKLWKATEDLAQAQAKALIQRTVSDRQVRLQAALSNALREQLAPQLQRRSQIPEQVRSEVWRRDAGKCSKCGVRENLEFDHIIPFSRGGSSTVRNLELLCENCNRKKSNRI
jgi:hypothetical protein